MLPFFQIHNSPFSPTLTSAAAIARVSGLKVVGLEDLAGSSSSPIMEETHTINLPSGEQITIGGETHTAETSSGVQCTIQGGDESDLRRVMERMEKGGLTTPDGASLLHMAAASMTANHCGFFIETLKCDINGTDDKGKTPLFEAINQRNRETTYFLVENGADVTWRNTDGETPLHFAANRGSKEIVQLLISKGADLHANSYRGTPLLYAAASGNRETLEYLLELKADPNTNPSGDMSPFIQALFAKNISIECLELLVKGGADPNRASHLVTPLGYAAPKCDEGITKFLLKAGADPNTPDIMGLKPIEKAASQGRREVVELLFPVTSRIECYPDWSVSGAMQHAKSREEESQSKSNHGKIYLFAKAKGDEAFEKKNYYDAAAWYHQALQADPTDAKILCNRSLCYTLLNNGRDALKDALACTKLRPNWAKAHYREGAAWKVLKKFKQAAKAFSQALALDPRNKEINKELRAVKAELKKGSH